MWAILLEENEILITGNRYNRNIEIDDLYSGLLQRQVVDKVCVKKDGKLNIPDIPEEIKKCVLASKFYKPTSRLFFTIFTIVDPQNESNKKTVRTELKNVEPCSLMNNESHVNEKDQAQAVNQLKVIVPISISVLVLVVLLMVVVACVCSKRFRYKKVMKVDLNVNYDTAGVDYEYGSADYDSMGDEISTGRREIKMEVVDRFLKESFLSLDFLLRWWTIVL